MSGSEAFNPRVTKAWYIACHSTELKSRPLRRKILGQPIVLFRGQGGTVGALLDRCPHRGVRLSGGQVRDGQLQCPYHGWEFNTEGRCMRVPALVGEADRPNRCATRFAVREQQGFVWVYAEPGEAPVGEPHRFAYADDPNYLVVRYDVRAKASVHAVAENALDVPHTGFLHAGLFRTDSNRNRIRCVVERHADRVECEYIGEPRPEGLVGRLLSPSGGVVTHFDRFFLPSIVEVEYRIGDENHIVVNGACTPVDADDTRLYSVTAVRTRFPAWLLRPFVQPVALWIFGQDRGILEEQTEVLHEVGNAAFVSTEIDLLGPHILKLLHRAARGESGDSDNVYRTEVEMEV